MNGVQLLVIAKEPVPGRVKTRLCPPCTPAQAARIAEAALLDTLDAAAVFPAVRHTLVLSGQFRTGPGWRVVPQSGGALGRRLAHAFTGTAVPDTGTLLIGMDTPQVTTGLLASVRHGLADADAVLAPAEDGGWWALALRDPTHAAPLDEVPMSRPDTGELTARALRRAGLVVASGPVLRDVDTATDAWQVAESCPGGRFAAAVRDTIPLVRR